MNFGGPIGVSEMENHLKGGAELGHHHRVAGGQSTAEGDLVAQ